MTLVKLEDPSEDHLVQLNPSPPYKKGQSEYVIQGHSQSDVWMEETIPWGN